MIWRRRFVTFCPKYNRHSWWASASALQSNCGESKMLNNEGCGTEALASAATHFCDGTVAIWICRIHELIALIILLFYCWRKSRHVVFSSSCGSWSTEIVHVRLICGLRRRCGKVTHCHVFNLRPDEVSKVTRPDSPGPLKTSETTIRIGKILTALERAFQDAPDTTLLT